MFIGYKVRRDNGTEGGKEDVIMIQNVDDIDCIYKTSEGTFIDYKKKDKNGDVLYDELVTTLEEMTAKLKNIEQFKSIQ